MKMKHLFIVRNSQKKDGCATLLDQIEKELHDTTHSVYFSDPFINHGVTFLESVTNATARMSCRAKSEENIFFIRFRLE